MLLILTSRLYDCYTIKIKGALVVGNMVLRSGWNMVLRSGWNMVLRSGWNMVLRSGYIKLVLH